MSPDKAPNTLGSDAWLGASEYERGSELHTRATNFFTAVKWDTLTTIAFGIKTASPASLRTNFPWDILI